MKLLKALIDKLSRGALGMFLLKASLGRFSAIALGAVSSFGCSFPRRALV